MNRFKDLYKRFLNGERLLIVARSKTLRRIRFYWLMAFAISFIPATILCSAGINEKYFTFPENLIYWFVLGFILLSLFNSALFLLFSIKSGLFKSKAFLFLVAFTPLVGIILAFLMSFTGIPYTEADGTKAINIVIPMAYMLFVGLPLAVLYLFFCYCTFIGKIQQDAATLLKEEAERYKAESKESVEELKKEVFSTVTYKYHAHQNEKNRAKEKEL